MLRKLMTSVLSAALALPLILPAQATVGLTNPAAEFCIAEGGLYGIRQTGSGAIGICQLPDGTEINAWDHYRGAIRTETVTDNAKIANPAASYCAALGGTYDLETSECMLPDGTKANAWSLLRDAHAKTVTLSNPAALFCIEQGGAYEIRSGETGQAGICKFTDGSEQDAWAFYRTNN